MSKKMDTYALDAEHFINEISKHPALWDFNSQDNKCSFSKEEAWTSVAKTFISNYDEMSKSMKREIFRKMQGKWRNLRDNYVRSVRRKGDDQRTYAYAKNMAFLDPVYKKRPPRKFSSPKHASNDSQSNDEYDSLNDSSYGSYYGKGNKRRRKEKFPVTIKEESSSEEEVEFLEVKTEGEIEVPWTSSQQKHEDKLFFDSLLPVVHEFDLDQKLELRTKILQLITTIRAQGNSQGLNGSISSI